MIVGVPKEIKNKENRVSMVVAGVRALTQAGHKVLVQSTAGLEPVSPTRNTLLPVRRSSIRPKRCSGNPT